MHDNNAAEEFLQLLEEYGAESVLSLLIRYAELQDDVANQELAKDLKRVYHRYRSLSDQ